MHPTKYNITQLENHLRWKQQNITSHNRTRYTPTAGSGTVSDPESETPCHVNHLSLFSSNEIHQYTPNTIHCAVDKVTCDRNNKTTKQNKKKHNTKTPLSSYPILTSYPYPILRISTTRGAGDLVFSKIYSF